MHIWTNYKNDLKINTSTDYQKDGSIDCIWTYESDDNKVPVQTLSDNKSNKSKSVSKNWYDTLVSDNPGKNALDKLTKKLTPNNITEIYNDYSKNFRNEKAGGLILDILKSKCTNAEKIRCLEKIKDVLAKKVEKLGGNADYFKSRFHKCLHNPSLLLSLPALVKDMVAVINRLEEMKKRGDEEKSEKLPNEFIKEGREIWERYFKGLDTNDIVGNGKIDHNIMQSSGNCWIHNCIASLARTPAGKAHLENLVTKRPNGNIVVYLPAAKKAGVPKPKGDGIFVYTEKQVMNSATNESVGDGDVTAICMAISDYRKLCDKEYNSSDTGNIEDFLYLIYGEKDIEVETLMQWPNLVNKDKKYNKLLEYFNSKEYVIEVAVSSETYYELINAKSESKDNSAHALTIIKMDRNYVELLDSNKPYDPPIKVSKEKFLKCCQVKVAKIPKKL